jgi:cytochrome c oxidase assembly factor CtaG
MAYDGMSVVRAGVRTAASTGGRSTNWPPGFTPLRAVAFVSGVLVLLLSLVSPLDTLGDVYLFSAHMAQHLLLVEVVPPLLLIGVPPDLFAWLLRWPPLDVVERVLGRAAVAWPVGIVTLWVWHAPALYEAALANEGIHVVQHLCFLVAWTIFWWPVVAPLAERRRLSSLAVIGYLIGGSLASSVLGIILTFSPAGIYPAYLHPFDRLGILPLLRGQWGLTPEADQRLGGGLMWMLGSLVFLLAIIGTYARWSVEADDDSERAGAAAIAALAGQQGASTK